MCNGLAPLTRLFVAALAFSLAFGTLVLHGTASATSDTTQIDAPSGIVVSANSTRSDPQGIEVTPLTGDVFVFMDVARNVRKVSYYLDDPNMGSTPFRLSDSHPFDLAGSNGSHALPFDSTSIDDGKYTLSAAQQLANGRIVVVHARVTIANADDGPPSDDPEPTEDPAEEPSEDPAEVPGDEPTDEPTDEAPPPSESGLPTGLDLYVSTTGRNSNPGTHEQPLRTISAAVAAASKETTIGIFNGTYRETVDINRNSPTHLVGESRDGTIVSGAEAYTSWTEVGGGVWRTSWDKNWGVANNPWPGQTNPPEVWLRRELVFADDNLLRQHVTYTEMAAELWSFYVDDEARRIYVRLPQPPANFNLEIAERSLGVNLRSAGSIRHMTIQRVADREHHDVTAALRVAGTHGQALEDLRIKHASHYGVRINQSDVSLTDVDASDNGSQGISSHRGMDQTYRRVTADRNNFRGGLWGDWTSWHPGNKHSRTRRLQIYDSQFNDNYSRGLWFDIDVSDVLVQDTVMNGNVRAGTYFEYASGPAVYRRSVANNNDGAGFAINSDNVFLDSSEAQGNTGDVLYITGSMGRTFTAWQDATQTLWDGPTISGLPRQGESYNPRNHNIGWRDSKFLVSHHESTNRWAVRVNYSGADEAEVVANLGIIRDNHYWSDHHANRMSRAGSGNRTLSEWRAYAGKDHGSVFSAP